MKTSESTQHIAPAFVEICGALENPKRNRVVTVTPRNGAPYEFSYATLDGILDLLRPICHASKCAITQVLGKSEENVPILETRLMHETGEWMASEIDLVLSHDRAQAVGSLLTYYRRYALCALFPIAGLEDEGGAVAEGAGIQDGRASKGFMTGAELTDAFLEEFYERDSLLVTVKNNDWKQWRGWFEKLIDGSGSPPVLTQLWNDNEDNLANIARDDYNRLRKRRNAKFDKWKQPVPAEWADPAVADDAQGDLMEKPDAD